MDNGKFVSNDKNLERALETVRTNRAEAAKFAADPESYLKAKGVATAGLKFNANAELSDAELQAVAGGVAAESISVCASAGCIVCATVGGGNAY